ncbi:hypothetical protein cypCar_00049807, partial [Cyprinus carpio]
KRTLHTLQPVKITQIRQNCTPILGLLYLFYFMITADTSTIDPLCV